LIVAVILVPMIVLVVECLAALLPGRAEAGPPASGRPRAVVLVPAHNEETGIARTIQAILPQLEPGDRVLVVADNCSDRTAELARAAGATVVERTDATRRGKGFALDFGIRQLEPDPPEVVLVIDADTLLRDGTVGRLVWEVAQTGRPAQAASILDSPPGGGYKAQLSSFAFLFKNVVRPMGLHRLGLPRMLTGTGMALPWSVLHGVELANANIVEDMKLGVDLAVAGHPARFCPEAQVSGELPTAGRAAVTQRTRWEHGHLQTLATQVPRLFGAALRQRRLDLLGLALELSVPPLSMLFLLGALAAAAALGWWATGGSIGPAVALGAGMLAVLLSIFLAWAKYGRERLPFLSLLAAPFYVLWKIPIYLAFLVRRQQAWVRTERTSPAPDQTAPGNQ
jgi:cellulose synthase/poly-beta-1,6-N-acetylglucosamine synthase-like glycosyltransferase